MTEKKVKLTDVAIRTSIKCEPEINHQVRWVGADHLDEGDFTVRRWSTTDDPLFPPTFKFAVQPGSVLIHSRNPKKVATLDFEAITGEKFFCLISKDSKILLSSYLAFQLQSDRFSEYVEHHFTGSVNKFLNWSALAAYEFVLPTIKDQQKIVQLLSGVDAHAEALRIQLNVAQESRKAVLHHLLITGGDDWTETTLGEVGESGFFSDGDWVESKDQDPEGNCRLVQLADIGDGIFLDKSDRWLNDEQFLRLRCTALKPRDILIARMPDPAARACLFPDGLPKSATVVDVAILRCGSDVLPEFLMPLINDSTFRDKAISLLTGTTRQRIARSKLASITFFLPPLQEQQRIVDEISKIDAVIQETTSALAATRQLRNALLNKEIS